MSDTMLPAVSVYEPPSVKAVVLSRQAMVASLAAAAVIGAAYSFSPLTVIFAAVMFPLFRAAVRGVSGTERKLILGSLLVALAFRLAALVTIYVATDAFREQFKSLFGDGGYSVQRSLWILNEWKGLAIGPLYRLNIYYPYGDVVYDRLLAAIQWFLGPSPYGLTLMTVAAFFGGAVLLYRVARRSFGPAAAAVGLVALLFWPTFVAWSISMLKECVHMLLSAVAVAAAVRAVRVESRRTRAVLVGVLVTAIVLVGHVRSGSEVIVVGAVLLGYAVGASVWRSAAFVGLLAATAVGVVVLITQPGLRSRVQAEVSLAVHYHVGHVKTFGKAYRAADQYFYDEWPKAPLVSFGQGARFVLRSAAMFVLVPLPLHVVSASELAYLPEHFAWCLLVLLAVAGAVVGLRHDAWFAGMCAGYFLAGMFVISLHSGNIGTLVRHRDAVTPFMVWLSGTGAVGLLGRFSRKPYASH